MLTSEEMDKELQAAVRDYVNECVQSSNIGRFYSTSDPEEVEAFAEWFSSFAMSAVRWHSEKKKVTSSDHG